MDLLEPTNSKINGFSDTSITSIPFQSSVDVNEASLNISLRHQVQVGLFINTFVGAGIGAYIDLPKYLTDFEKVQGVDETCTSLASSQSENKDLAQEILKDVYNITPSVGWQAGFAGEYNVGDFPFHE